ncbi:unnamed protein product [Cylicocyclus nassatus]|uniref:Uncharacterized protein n=1 Tax=Cylicocyclus nassatus TaxID=53992 RepID=A0AA36GEI3_CYLNA|nr:unnamed protein product [Cylicocyclus nassatus]
MAAHLITDKRLLTHYCNKLDTIISRFKGEELETLNVAAAQGESASQYTRESLQRLSEAIGALDTVTHNIKQTMTEYATKFTELDYPTEKDKQDFEEYSAKAEKALISATDYLLVLKARVHAFIVVKAEPEHNQHSGSVQYLEEEISTDEMLAVYMKNTKPDPTPTKPDRRRSDRIKTYLGTCMYCEGRHKPADCKKYSTPQERSDYLRNNKLCLICASAQHSTANCKKRMCFRCGGPHHTSCCFRGDIMAGKGAPTKTSPPVSEGKKPKARDTERHLKHTETRKVNALHEDNSETEAVSALDLQPVHKTRRELDHRHCHKAPRKFTSERRDGKVGSCVHNGWQNQYTNGADAYNTSRRGRRLL